MSGSSELTLLRNQTATVLNMDENIRMLLEQTPEKPPRSKLEPHVDVIVTLRRKRRSYREIAEFFREHLAIAVAPSTIHDFVRIRRRRGKLSTSQAESLRRVNRTVSLDRSDWI
jgi:hypothetical protein